MNVRIANMQADVAACLEIVGVNLWGDRRRRGRRWVFEGLTRSSNKAHHTNDDSDNQRNDQPQRRFPFRKEPEADRKDNHGQDECGDEIPAMKASHAE